MSCTVEELVLKNMPTETEESPCYVCLENTTESSCENGCVVHDRCIREALRSGHPKHCTICRRPLRITGDWWRRFCDNRIVHELSVTMALVSQVAIVSMILAAMLMLSKMVNDTVG